MKKCTSSSSNNKGVEGKKDAIHWLEINGFKLLARLAKAADNDHDQMRWLMLNDKLFGVIAQRIKLVKDEIEQTNNDIHRWGYE